MALRFLILTLINIDISNISIYHVVAIDSMEIYISILLIYNTFSSNLLEHGVNDMN